MSYTKILKYETLRSFNSTGLVPTYQPVGTPLEHPASIVKMVNNSNALMTISVDGINDVDVVPPNSFWLYDITSNTPTHGDDAIFIPQGTQYLVKGTESVSNAGSLYLVVLYIVQV